VAGDSKRDAAPAPGGGAAGGRFRRAFERAAGRAALAAFMPAGYPSLEATPALLDAMVAGGADIIELGVPFSDPVADGPTIQRASEIALANGASLPVALEMASGFRSRHAEIPLVLMGYANALLNYGLDRFAEAAGEAGVDGVIVVDLPVEHAQEWRGPLSPRGIATILLASPTTSPERMARIAAESEGFVYCVSLKGVTGAASFDAEATGGLLAALKEKSDLPVLAGFGIRTPEQARAAASRADGIVVGSALVEIAGECGTDEIATRVASYLSGLAEACARP